MQRASAAPKSGAADSTATLETWRTSTRTYGVRHLLHKAIRVHCQVFQGGSHARPQSLTGRVRRCTRQNCSLFASFASFACPHECLAKSGLLSPSLVCMSGKSIQALLYAVCYPLWLSFLSIISPWGIYCQYDRSPTAQAFRRLDTRKARRACHGLYWTFWSQRAQCTFQERCFACTIQKRFRRSKSGRSSTRAHRTKGSYIRAQRPIPGSFQPTATTVRARYLLLSGCCRSRMVCS